MKRLLLSSLLAAICGCASGPVSPSGITPTERQTQFLAEEYAPFRASGTGRIEGQVFLRTMAGDVKPGAGAIVTMNPATTHGREWFDLFMSDLLPAAGDPRAAEFVRRVQCDASGGFAFAGLPAGRYCLISGVVWQAGYRMTGATVGAVVDVRDGETARAIMTR